MARKSPKPVVLLWQVSFFFFSAILTGFLTVLLAKLLGRYLASHWAVTLGVGAAVTITLWVSQWVKNPPFLLKGVSPLVAGFCAGLGVHISRVWLT
ncbi:MAG: hypothetical protein JNM52_05035 [Betaproteobacteria bacterium]|nr:hypothetical protein [Betaproteobacteria bacterium]